MHVDEMDILLFLGSGKNMIEFNRGSQAGDVGDKREREEHMIEFNRGSRAGDVGDERCKWGIARKTVTFLLVN